MAMTESPNFKETIESLERQLAHEKVAREGAEASLGERSRQLTLSEERFHRVFDSNATGIVILDATGHVSLANQVAQALFGYPAATLCGMAFGSLFENAATLDPPKSTSPTKEIQVNAIREDGTPVAVEIVYGVADALDTTEAVVFIRDRSSEAEVQARLYQLSQFDVLTGVPNRRLFQSRVEEELQKSQRGPEQLAVIMLDIDRFKRINNSLGHSAADEVLLAVARRLESGIAKVQDGADGGLAISLARLGGDEFGVLMLCKSHEGRFLEDDAVSTVTVMLDELRSTPLEISATPIWITISAGIALYTGGRADFSSLLKKADVALYHAKSSGSEFAFYRDHMTMTPSSYLKTEVELYEAIQAWQFTPYFQPRIELETARVIGAEALVRWQHPDNGLMAPGEFLPVATSARLIDRIDQQMLHMACQQMASWRDSGFAELTVSVNVSERMLKSGKLLDQVKRNLEQHNLASHWLEIEINEEVLMKEMSVAINQLEGLREMGVLISIDDFGTGRTALRWLHDLPVDIMKIDQSFILDLAHHPETQAVVKSVIQLGQALQLEVVAEGVETAADEAVLKSLQCTRGQGYYYSKPLPAAEFEDRFLRGA